MPRHCERPGCSQPADAIYGMSATLLSVWLEPYDEKLAARAGVLCRHHADAMVVPRGWSLEDRRDPTPRLFAESTGAATAPTTVERPPVGQAPPEVDAPVSTPRGEPKPRPKRPRKKADETGQLELGAELLPEEPAAAAEEPTPAPPQPADDYPIDPTPFSPWRPKFDQSDDLDGLLQARSPLLSRAFRGKQPGGRET